MPAAAGTVVLALAFYAAGAAGVGAVEVAGAAGVGAAEVAAGEANMSGAHMPSRLDAIEAEMRVLRRALARQSGAAAPPRGDVPGAAPASFRLQLPAAAVADAPINCSKGALQFASHGGWGNQLDAIDR